MRYAHSSNLRLGRHSSSGNIYLITTVTHRRRHLFTNLYAARRVIQNLHLHDDKGGCTTLAYVLMPDHLHWLVQLNGNDLSSLMRNFKSFSAREANKILCGNDKVWQPGYYDHALRKEEDLQAAARYIVTNPLRKGLVNNIGDYPHWDALWLGHIDDDIS